MFNRDQKNTMEKTTLRVVDIAERFYLKDPEKVLLEDRVTNLPIPDRPPMQYGDTDSPTSVPGSPVFDIAFLQLTKAGQFLDSFAITVDVEKYYGDSCCVLVTGINAKANDRRMAIGSISRTLKKSHTHRIHSAFLGDRPNRYFRVYS